MMAEESQRANVTISPSKKPLSRIVLIDFSEEKLKFIRQHFNHQSHS
jgi:hypothetical protein